MKIAIVICTFILLTIVHTAPGPFKSCIKNSFQSTCKAQLYNCFNTSDCSYQLHTNTQHIFIRDEDTSIAKIYFSNPIAIALHQCLNQQCKIGQMDKNYPQTLPNDYCIMEVWDICGGDVQQVYKGVAIASIMNCYKLYCPKLKTSQQIKNMNIDQY